MRRKPTPSQEILKKYLYYNKKTGIICYKPRTIEDFLHCKNPENACNAWNARNAGFKFGPYYGRIGEQKIGVHRIVWKLEHNTDPEFIYHIDGNPANNRITNLKAGLRIRSDNTSGFQNIRYNKVKKKWMVDYRKNKKNIFVGYFNTIEGAKQALDQSLQLDSLKPI